MKETQSTYISTCWELHQRTQHRAHYKEQMRQTLHQSN